MTAGHARLEFVTDIVARVAQGRGDRTFRAGFTYQDAVNIMAYDFILTLPEKAASRLIYGNNPTPSVTDKKAAAHIIQNFALKLLEPANPLVPISANYGGRKQRQPLD